MLNRGICLLIAAGLVGLGMPTAVAQIGNDGTTARSRGHAESPSTPTGAASGDARRGPTANSECASQFGKATDGMIRDNVGQRRPCF